MSITRGYFFVKVLINIILIAYNVNVNCQELFNQYIPYSKDDLQVNNLFTLLPLKNAIVERHGNGNLKVAIFTDIYCPYCRKQEQVLDLIDNLTIYSFVIAVLNHKEYNFEKSVQIWCSKDKAKAFNDFMSKSIDVAEVTNCTNPIRSNKNLYYAFGFESVPIIVFPNGKYYEGGSLDKDLLIQIIKENQ